MLEPKSGDPLAGKKTESLLSEILEQCDMSAKENKPSRSTLPLTHGRTARIQLLVYARMEFSS